MMKNRTFTITLIVIGLCLLSFSYFVNGQPSFSKKDISNDIELIEFSESITDFHIVFSIPKKTFIDSKIASISESDIGFDVVNDYGLSNFNNRFLSNSYKIKDNGSEYIVFFDLKCKASNTSHFKIDVIPTFKNALSINSFAWWNNNWGYRKTVEVNSISQVPGSLNNFPILFNYTSNDLKNNAQSDGGDIVFTTIDNTTIYPHEIEYYNSVTGQLIAWINISSLPHDSDLQFNMYYGNAGVADQWDIINTWDTDYIMVQHFNESSGTLYDSTNYNHDGTLTDGDADSTFNVNARIAGGFHFNGDADFIEISNTADLYLPDGFTIESWISADTTNEDAIICQGESTLEREYLIEVNGFYDSRSYVYDSNSDDMDVGVDNGYNSFSDGWNHLVVTWNGIDATGVTNHYHNGITAPLSKDDNANFDGMRDGNGDLTIGAKYFPGVSQVYYDGVLDEVRISKLARSYSWIMTSYNCMNNDTIGGFIKSVSGEISKPVESVEYEPNATGFNIGNNSNNIGICQNISFYIYDDNGDKIYYTIEGNNSICSLSGNSFNNTIWLNCSNCKYLGHNYTVWLNLTNDNISYHNYYFEFRTEDCCFNLGDNMDIAISFDNTLVFTILLTIVWLVFTALHFRYRDEIIIGWVQLFVSMPLMFLYGAMGNGFVMGYALAVILPLLAIIVMVDAYLNK